ncbi:MAG: carboxynorspermidine decarboxylase [Bacteroidales bacterium]|nr:carboxynorspermidine decarboxylase [Bacteroidales bacterium]
MTQRTNEISPLNIEEIPSPSYVIVEEKLRQNLKTISHVKAEAGVNIILALKGFAMWKVFPIIKEYGFLHATASSYNEARLAFENFGTPVHTYCPAYSDVDFELIAQMSSHLTFNSLSQFYRFADIARKINPKISLGLRVNPEYSEVKTILYNPCAPGSRLGITAETLLKEGLPKEVEGLHFHSLCESSSFALENTLASFEKLFSPFLSQIKWVNMGGGHLMTRKDYDRTHLITLLKNFKKRYPHLEIILEPGAAFVWETGYLIATVLDIVDNHGIKTAMLDVSFTAHMPDCLEMPYKPIILGATDEKADMPTYRMGGNSCLAGDFLGNWSFDHELSIGEKIIFNDMIHYTMVKTTMFNGVRHPHIGMWTKEGKFELFRTFEYEDYKNRMC